MLIMADEHVAEKIVHVVQNMALSSGWRLSSVAGSGMRGESDVYWATQFAKEGGTAILTADTDFFKKPHQVIAIQRTGLKVIHLPARWQNARCHLQAAHILLWWKRIEQKLTECKNRECWQVPWQFNEGGELKQQFIDFHRAEKQHKKALKRAHA